MSGEEGVMAPAWTKLPAEEVEWIGKLIHIARAARAEAEARDAMLSVVPIGAYGRGESALMTIWIEAGARLDEALGGLP